MGRVADTFELIFRSWPWFSASCVTIAVRNSCCFFCAEKRKRSICSTVFIFSLFVYFFFFARAHTHVHSNSRSGCRFYNRELKLLFLITDRLAWKKKKVHLYILKADFQAVLCRCVSLLATFATASTNRQYIHSFRETLKRTVQHVLPFYLFFFFALECVIQ